MGISLQTPQYLYNDTLDSIFKILDEQSIFIEIQYFEKLTGTNKRKKSLIPATS